MCNLQPDLPPGEMAKRGYVTSDPRPAVSLDATPLLPRSVPLAVFRLQAISPLHVFSFACHPTGTSLWPMAASGARRSSHTLAVRKSR